MTETETGRRPFSEDDAWTLMRKAPGPAIAVAVAELRREAPTAHRQFALAVDRIIRGSAAAEALGRGLAAVGRGCR